MTEAQNFIHPSSLSETKQKMLMIEEAKIKTLENRFMGPSSEGNLPIDYEPLQESEFENLKNKILLAEQCIPQLEVQKSNNSYINTSKDKSSKSLGKKNSNGDGNGFSVLMKKRYREAKTNTIDLSDTSQLSQDNNNNNQLEFEVFSSNNCTMQNDLFKMKDKHIKDYYNSMSTPSKSNIELYSKGYSTAPQIKRAKNENNPDENSSNYNDLTYIKFANEKKKELQEKDKEISKWKSKVSEMEEINKVYLENQKALDEEIKRCRADMSQFVKEIEELKRQIKKKWLHEQQYRIGKVGHQRFSQGKLIDYWEDGEEYNNLKKKIEEIRIEKEEVEKQKRKLAAYKTKLAKQNNSAISGIDQSILHSNSNLDLINNNSGSNNNSNNEQDMKDLLSFRWNSLQREENEFKEKKEKLDDEKVVLIHELNLFNEETKCFFIQKRDTLPLLAKRYQIISLLGKGGYSEVYKAYDLENHMYVACKIHQLNPSWKEEVKDNYIKHTIRENQIHKDIDHCKVVKHYDTIEIDNNSFCTVLEYCTGPDLATYLQRNRLIQEKEARIIITQILMGLEYLNKLPNKIIHYDLKPQNIIFHHMEVKISDFGLAKIVDINKDKVQLTSQGVGTYWYLPPECFEDKNVDITSKVDIWSCGVILYELFFRKKPFGDNYSQDKIIKERVMMNAKRVDFPPKPVLSDDCKEFIRNCLAFKPEDRYDVFQSLESPFIKQDKIKSKKDKAE